MTNYETLMIVSTVLSLVTGLLVALINKGKK